MALVGLVVLIGYVFLVPMMFLFLGVVSWRRDRIGATVSFAAALLLALQFLAMGPPQYWAEMPRPLVLAIALFSAFALAFRLWRDRRAGHIRSTTESLAVLTIGAILLLLLFSIPSLMAMGGGLGRI